MKEQIEKIQEMLPHPKVDIFRTHHHPYYIFSLEYMQESAGLRSYYYLCHFLNELGYEAYVITDEPPLGLRTPPLTIEIIEKHKKEGRHPIAIYGETTPGNPLNGDIVVRWILNKVGHIGEYVTFDINDLVYYWSSLLSNCTDKVKLLYFKTIDRTIFNRDNVNDAERESFCYFAHKCFYFGNKLEKLSDRIKANGISLCKDIKRTHTEIADIMRHSKVLYCYELSSIGSEALLCGCPIILVNTPYLDDFKELKNNAICPVVSEADIDFSFIPSIDENWYANYEKDEVKGYKTIAQFIKDTQKAANDYNHTKKKHDDFITFCTDYYRIFIYGAGQISRHCYHVMKAIGIYIEGFVVSDEKYDEMSSQKNLYNHRILRLSEVDTANRSKLGFVIATSIPFHKEIIEELGKSGFLNYTLYPLLIR